MFSFRNGSLLANALLIAIGAAAGTGVTLLVAPLTADHQERITSNRGLIKEESSAQGNALAPKAGGSSQPASVTSLTTEPFQSDQSNDDATRAAAIREAGAEAARKNPATALLLAASYTSEQDKLEFLRGIYSVWGATDPVAALEYAKGSLPAGLARSETIGIAVNKWAAQDPRGAWMWTENNLSGPVKEQAFNDVIIGWTRKTPTAAAQWLASTGYNSQPLFNAVATTWAEQNPKAAATWAATLTNSDARHTAEVAVASEWATQHPQEAAEHYTPEVTQPDGAALATTIADIWGTTNPAATADWVNQLPPGPGKDEAAATLATVWAASDIKAAVAWAGSLSDENMRRQVITHIGTTWGAIEPDSALDWLYSLPSTIAADGIAGAFNSWAATDAIGLREWVDQNPPAPEMDQARQSLADVLSSSDILSSMDLAFQLSSQTGRDDAAARYFRLWRKTDDASAQAWLTQNWNGLEGSTQQRLTLEQNRTVVAR